MTSKGGGMPSDEFQMLLREELSALRLQLQDLASGQALAQTSLTKIREDVEGLLALKVSASEGEKKSNLVHFGVDDKETDEHHNWAPITPVATLQAQLSSQKTLSSQDGGFDEQPADVATRSTKTKSELVRLFEISNQLEANKQQRTRKFERANLYERWHWAEAHVKDMVLDSFIGFVIVMNSIFIGISADNWDGREINAYVYVDAVFAIIFAVELVLKIRLHGWRGHFLGRDRISNGFDLTLVTLDTLQLLLVFSRLDINQTLQDQGIPSASVFRVLRIARVTRILRLLRYPAFADVLKMIEGLLLGTATLGWAVLLFGIVIYLFGILARDAMGDEQQYKEVFPYFHSVPRSIFTVFRCSFGDCSTSGGLPIAEYIQLYYGGTVSLVYSLFIFFITVGLFNVVSAIFVDATMARAEENRAKELHARFASQELWATNVCKIVRRCLESSGFELYFTRSSVGITADMLNAEIKRDLIDDLCRHDQDTIAALTALDIDQGDHDKLADILDPDHSGTVGFAELTNGLRRLRGQPRRSDVVTIDLMVRSTQEKLNEMQKLLENTFAKLSERQQYLL